MKAETIGGKVVRTGEQAHDELDALLFRMGHVANVCRLHEVSDEQRRSLVVYLASDVVTAAALNEAARRLARAVVDQGAAMPENTC